MYMYLRRRARDILRIAETTKTSSLILEALCCGQRMVQTAYDIYKLGAEQLAQTHQLAVLRNKAQLKKTSKAVDGGFQRIFSSQSSPF